MDPRLERATSRPRGAESGFTLIELLVVIGVLGLLAVAIVPDLVQVRQMAHSVADQCNLREQAGFVEQYRRKLGHYPTQGGHRFLLQPWVEGVIPHTKENLDRYFSPGARDTDPRYAELTTMFRRGEPFWQSLDELSSQDTHYAARATEHLRGLNRPNEAWAATDNEGGWVFDDGTINVLYSGVNVRSYSLPMLQSDHGWPGMAEVFPTHGPASPRADLRKLRL